MARILLFAVLAFLVWMGVRMLTGGRRRDEGPPRSEPSAQRSPEPIAQCAWCGAHAPVATAQSLPDGRIYCSDAHREQARLAGTPPDRSGS